VYICECRSSSHHIGSVAKRIGLTPDAIWFYERNELLPGPPRTEGGFRLYGESDVETLAFGRRVQGLGFKISEIREVAGSERKPFAAMRTCAASIAGKAHRCAKKASRPIIAKRSDFFVGTCSKPKARVVDTAAITFKDYAAHFVNPPFSITKLAT
jgi:DNA-binding transcriptional MerR regulator